MEDVIGDVEDKVKELSDLELAALICLVADEHCIIAADDDFVDDLENELRLIATETFGLTCQVINCSPRTSLDDFGDGVLLNQRDANDSPGLKDDGATIENKPREPGIISGLAGSHRPGLTSRTLTHEGEVAEVIIAKNLDLVDHQVQIQALELLRGRRIFSRTGYHTAPKKFLFVALLSATGAPNLVDHLNDHFFISHYHRAEDGFANLEDRSTYGAGGDKISLSWLRLIPGLDDVYGGDKYKAESLFSKGDIDVLSQQAIAVRMGAEVRTYLHNIITFMRLHRAVAGGVSSQATRHFHQLVHTLAPLHGIDFVTPSLVALAARKIFPHRILLVQPENERSLQWGSSLDAVREALDGVTVDDVIEDILEEVEVPV